MLDTSSITVEPLLSDRADTLIRKYATYFTATLSIVVGITGTMMFFHFFKGKIQDMHAWIGMAFLLAVISHAFKNRRSLVPLFSKPLTHVLLGIVAVVAIIFVSSAPPAKSNPGNSVSQALIRVPLDKAAPALGMSTEVAIARLASAGGVGATSAQSIAAIARLNNNDPMKLLMAMMDVERKK
jgi:hypothetical protein